LNAYTKHGIPRSIWMYHILMIEYNTYAGVTPAILPPEVGLKVLQEDGLTPTLETVKILLKWGYSADKCLALLKKHDINPDQGLCVNLAKNFKEGNEEKHFVELLKQMKRRRLTCDTSELRKGVEDSKVLKLLDEVEWNNIWAIKPKKKRSSSKKPSEE
jgi:hypothetical protein